MTFIHPILLGGLVLVGVPIVLHLIMRQQPKRLVFPAFRFLKLRQRTNQRKLRLRHIILLALRVLLIALMCLALARPKLFSDRFGFLGDDQAATVVLVVDTSPSMEYAAAGKSRLDDAKARALELLDEVGDSSRIAVLDTAEPVAEWAASRAAARDRVLDLKLRPGNRPVTEALDTAFRLFASAEFAEAGDDAKPRFVYVFSDRTPASWDATRAADLKTRRDQLPDPKPRLVYVDVGVDQPVDVAVADLEVRPQAVPANRPVTLNVTIQATGQDCDTELSCRFDGDVKAERRPVRLRAGERQVVTFERRELKPGYHQAEIALATADNLPGNNVRYATVLVREPRKVLILCDEPRDAKLWETAINRQGLYQCDVKSDRAAIMNLGPGDLAAYQAVCLLSMRAPGSFWENLEAYVRKGGGLAVAPGGLEIDKDDYSKEDSAVRRLLPGVLGQYIVNREGVALPDYQYQHKLTAPYRDWMSQPNAAAYLNSRRVYEYWTVKPAAGATVLIRYADKDRYPALLERSPAESNGRGKVLLFTTPMDGRQDAAGHAANNFNVDWYYFVLVNQAVRYLAGEAEDANLNHGAGSPVTVQLPLGPRFPTYTLAGPGLTGADTQVQRAESAGELRLTQPQEPGHYTLSGGNREWQARFSVNLPPDECLLLPRLMPSAIEELFGPDSVVQPGQNRRLKDALEGQVRQPVELFPWLMILLLLALAVENLLANKFYGQLAVGDQQVANSKSGAQATDG
jgi:hypothetical protein